MATYALIIRVASDCRIMVGKRGVIRFPRGWYLYIGSAKAGLRARLKRHLSQQKKLRWHIDYVLAHPEVSLREIRVAERDIECLTAQELLNAGLASVIKKGLGSSDCKCPSHLIHGAGALRAILQSLSRLGFSPYRAGSHA